MRNASVGFQCPDCVKEGARSTRQGKATYGGARSLVAGQVTSALIGLNVLVFIAVVATNGTQGKVLPELWLLPRSPFLNALPSVSGGAWWQLVTVMFTHLAIYHIGANMLSLYFVGPTVERVLGRARFVAVYLGSGLVASGVIMWFSPAASPTLGASGAIFGLLGAFAVLAFKIGADLRQVAFWIGLNLVITFTVSGISWQGHIGGLLGGVALTGIVVYAPRRHRELIQWAGIGLVVVLAVALSLVRAAALA